MMYPTGFDTALICKSGHVITSRLQNYPQLKSAFCGICGAATIDACQDCGKAIDGESMIDHEPGWPDPDFVRPSFCKHCGRQFPWTEESLNAAKELAAADSGLGDEDLKTFGLSSDR